MFGYVSCLVCNAPLVLFSRRVYHLYTGSEHFQITGHLLIFFCSVREGELLLFRTIITPSPRTPVLVILLSYTTLPRCCLTLLIVSGRFSYLSIVYSTAYCLGRVTALHL